MTICAGCSKISTAGGKISTSALAVLAAFCISDLGKRHSFCSDILKKSKYSLVSKKTDLLKTVKHCAFFSGHSAEILGEIFKKLSVLMMIYYCHRKKCKQIGGDMI